MIRINTFNKSGIKSFIKANYPLNEERKKIVQVSVWELEEFFSTENIGIKVLGTTSPLGNGNSATDFAWKIGSYPLLKIQGGKPTRL